MAITAVPTNEELDAILERSDRLARDVDELAIRLRRAIDEDAMNEADRARLASRLDDLRVDALSIETDAEGLHDRVAAHG